jgi:glutamate N-acetyltransferase/amino-acid N-acetyltransferase
MIHPQLVPHATMLVYILTDAAIEPADLQAYLNHPSTSASTASPSTATPPPTTPSCCSPPEPAKFHRPRNAQFAAALKQVCTSLARQIVADGEGITHVVELRIDGAASDADALKSPKPSPIPRWSRPPGPAADPNWGRLIAAIGYSGARSTPTASTSFRRSAHLPRRWPRR